MPLSFADLSDLVTDTLNVYQKKKWVDISPELQDYPVYRRMLKGNMGAKKYYKGGKGIAWIVQYRHSTTAHHTGPYSQDVATVIPLSVEASVSWCTTTDCYIFDLTEQALNDASDAQIVDLVAMRRHSCGTGQAALFETTFWGKPTGSTDVLTPHGIYSYLITGSSAGSHSGGNPAGFSSGVGLDSGTYTQWQNYWDSFTDYSLGVFMKKVRKANRKTKFIPPLDYAKVEKDPTFEYYTNEDGCNSIEASLIGANENFGKDVAGYQGEATILRKTVQYVPQLDNVSDASSNPFFAVNWGSMQVAVQDGWLLKESKVQQGDSHNVVKVPVDTIWQTVCFNRRNAGYKLTKS